MKILFPILLMMAVSFASAQNVIPLPDSVSIDSGIFVVPTPLRIRNHEKTSTGPIDFFIRKYKDLTGKEARLDNNRYIKNPGPEILLSVIPEMTKESYSIKVSKNGVIISA